MHLQMLAAVRWPLQYTFAALTSLWFRPASSQPKLAPLKNLAPTTRPAARMTIPRMELRAALLAAKLIQFTSEHLKVPLTRCHL